MEKQIINENEVEVIRELYENYKTYVKYQNKLKETGNFYCPECNMLHELNLRHKERDVCVEQFKEKERIRQREYRTKRKALVNL